MTYPGNPWPLETHNPTYLRGLILTVTVDHNWLTGDFEDEDDSEGWTEIETQLKELLSSFSSKWPDLKVEFEEWEGDPETEEL